MVGLPNKAYSTSAANENGAQAALGAVEGQGPQAGGTANAEGHGDRWGLTQLLPWLDQSSRRKASLLKGHRSCLLLAGTPVQSSARIPLRFPRFDCNASENDLPMADTKAWLMGEYSNVPVLRNH